jgi:hypothetical protein
LNNQANPQRSSRARLSTADDCALGFLVINHRTEKRKREFAGDIATGHRVRIPPPAPSTLFWMNLVVGYMGFLRQNAKS